MTAAETLAALGLTDYAEALSHDWEASQEARPGEIGWLDPAFVRAACRECYVPEQIAEAAVRTAQRVADCEALCALAWHLHYGVYVLRSAQWDTVAKWPQDLRAALGEDAACFYLLIVLSNLPYMQAEHRRRQIPAEVIRDTVLDLRLWLDTRGQGGDPVPNLGPVMVAWLSNHFRAGLYRLVRLQFQFANFEYPLHVFRHRETRAVLALSAAGVAFGPEGQRDRSGQAEGGWKSRFELTDAEAVGSPIVPTGRAVQKEVTLPTAEWERILAPGDKVFNLHIPGGEPMTHAGCGDSFRLAMEFFPRHYPEYDYRVFCCGSWILNSWLEEVLPPQSNLVRFQREVYLFPIPQWPPSMYSRVFGLEKLPEDLSQLPRETGLQRAILEAFESGRGVGGGAGGCLLFPEDFRWGEEVYRNQKLPIEL